MEDDNEALAMRAQLLVDNASKKAHRRTAKAAAIQACTTIIVGVASWIILSPLDVGFAVAGALVSGWLGEKAGFYFLKREQRRLESGKL